jgi:hypothetical protein
MVCCFTTVVYGWYQDFIPIYIYSVLKSFPQHYVKIFLLDELKENNRKSLEVIKKEVSDRFQIVENFKDLDCCEIKHSAALRFLLTREYFEDFEYVYFGDVDFLIYNQFDDNFVSYYLGHCEKTGLPFSNCWNIEGNRFRMTGLHFIIKDSYFDAMDKIIALTKIPTSIFRITCMYDDKWVTYDEQMLCYMISQVFDIQILKNGFRPLHGLHFGVFRKTSYGASFDGYVGDCLSMWSNNPKVDHLMNDDVFKKICVFVEEKKVVRILKKTNCMLYGKVF